MKIQKENMIHLLFPRRCPFCDQVLYSSVFTETELVCEECRNKLEYIKEPVCKKCGKPVLHERQEYCHDCGKRACEYVQGKSLWIYKDEVKESIYRFKYQNRQEYARYYGMELVRIYGGWIKKCQIEAIVPIPLHKARRRHRGFNQAELVAKEIGKQMEIPVYANLLIRTKNTRAQKQLNDEERKNNLKKAFKSRINEVQLNHILLVDDIYTTGSTINEAARALKKAGVKYIYYISISIGRGY